MKILLQLFSLKFITALLGLVYSILQVKYFGASRTIEIYFAAQSLVYLVTSLTQGGQLAEVFLPEYHKLNLIKPKLGYQGLNVVLTKMLIFGGIVILFIFLLAPVFINLLVPGFSQEDKDLAVIMFRVLLPYLFLQLANSFFITVLNADQKFGRAELLGVTNTVVNILSLILLYPFIKIWALVVSLLLGKIIEFIFYFSTLYRTGYRFQFLKSIQGFNHVDFFKTIKSTFLYVGATQFYSVVLTASISFLPEGTYAIFKYVQNLANKIRGVFIQPFLTIFFTRYSLLVQNSKSVVAEFTKNMSSIINVNSIIILGVILLGDLVIDVIWGGKKFDANNVQLAYVFLIFNTFAILIGSIGAVYRKMAVSQGQAKKLYFYWVFAQLLSAVCSYLLIKYFKVKGLYFILLLNTLFMSVVSYIIYKQKNTTYKFFNVSFLYNILGVFVAFLLKFLSVSYSNNFTFFLKYSYLIVSFIVLSLPLIFSTFKLLKNEKGIN